MWANSIRNFGGQKMNGIKLAPLILYITHVYTSTLKSTVQPAAVGCNPWGQ
jgi:hypothetical protein